MSTLEADVAIVGGGLIGCMAAHRLRLAGRSVIVLERGFVGGESSGVSFGSLRLQGQRGASLHFALHAQALWERVEDELGETVEFVRSGHVHLALDGEQTARLHDNAAHLRSAGLAVEILDREQIRDRWPFLAAHVVGASWSARDAVVNPRLVAPAFARAAMREGATILEQAEVEGAGYGNGRFELHIGGEARRTVISEVLVNAAGAWCGELASRFGEHIPVFAAGPAEIVTEPVAPFARPVFHVVDGSVLFRQTARGNLIVGGHPRMSVDARTRRTRVPPEKITTNLERLAAVVPQMRAHHVIRTWTGIEGYVADMLPVLGPSATTPGLFHACAFSGHGLQCGPAAAAAVTELITRGSTSVPIGSFGIERFTADSVEAVDTLEEEFHDDVLDAGNAS